ncbi:MAG: rhomboid family intramembrane serine protease [Methylotetracoccus sp.]
MFPLRDENPLVRQPIAILLIIGLNIAAWIFVQGLGNGPPLAHSLCLYGLIPGELFHAVPVNTQIPLGEGLSCALDGNTSALTLLSHMFLHGGWFHIIGNMWFLWVFGDNVEDAMGPIRFVAFYLLCGLAAAGAQIATDPSSAVPMVGASGAIGGVMGAYAKLYPKARVIVLIFFGIFWTTVSLPAIAMLGYWFVLQIAGGLPNLQGAGGGVAFWAHIGGFLAGYLLVIPMHRADYYRAHLSQALRPSARYRW